MSEVVAVRCHSCHVGMKIKSDYVGKPRKCPKCGAIFVVPAEDGTAQPPSREMMLELQRQAAKAKALEAAKAQAAAKAAETTGAVHSQNSAAGESPAVGTSAEEKPAPTISFGFGGSGLGNSSFSGGLGQPIGESSENGTGTEGLGAEDMIRPVERPKRLEPKFRYVILNSERLLGYWQSETGWQVNDGTKLVPARRNAQILPKQGDFRFLELQLGDVNGNFQITKIRIFQLARQYSITKIAQEENEVLSTIVGQASLTRSQKNALLQGLKAHFMRSVWADSQPIYDYLLNDDFHSHEIS